MSATTYVPSSVVATRLGIKVQTLAKWRCKGKGPRGWFHLSQTRCVYPEHEVDAFIGERMAERPKFEIARLHARACEPGARK